MDMDNDNTGMIAKTRCPALTNGVFRKPGADVANILRDWLHGAPPAPVQQYKDGSTVGAKERAYYQQHIEATGDAPENVAALREWYKAHKNGNGKAAQPQVAIVEPDPDSDGWLSAGQPALVTVDNRQAGREYQD
jgi:hypothetical protein